MLHLLVSKIENRHSSSTRYKFETESSYEEKLRTVSTWWNEPRFQLAMAVKKPSELNKFLNYSLSEEMTELLLEAKKKGMPFLPLPIIYLCLIQPARVITTKR